MLIINQKSWWKKFMIENLIVVLVIAAIMVFFITAGKPKIANAQTLSCPDICANELMKIEMRQTLALEKIAKELTRLRRKK